jgi:hypothetical protein
LAAFATNPSPFHDLTKQIFYTSAVLHIFVSMGREYLARQGAATGPLFESEKLTVKRR